MHEERHMKPAVFNNAVFLSLLLVLINVYTVTPDLRPVNDKVIQNVSHVVILKRHTHLSFASSLQQGDIIFGPNILFHL